MGTKRYDWSITERDFHAWCIEHERKSDEDGAWDDFRDYVRWRRDLLAELGLNGAGWDNIEV
jgi:hypothetical protein